MGAITTVVTVVTTRAKNLSHSLTSFHGTSLARGSDIGNVYNPLCPICLYVIYTTSKCPICLSSRHAVFGKNIYRNVNYTKLIDKGPRASLASLQQSFGDPVSVILNDRNVKPESITLER